jgi:purine-binding chemotaxis protein CheW
MSDQYFVFERSNESFCLDVTLVQEVTRLASVPVPQTPPMIVGLANLRGDILPWLNLDGLLGVSLGPQDADRPVLILREEDGTQYGVIVDRALGVRNMEGTPLLPLPEDASEQERQVMEGCFDVGEGRAIRKIDSTRMSLKVREGLSGLSTERT